MGAKIHPELIVDFQYRAIIAPEEPQIPTTQSKSSQCQSNPPPLPMSLVFTAVLEK